jgi:predicted HTH transcriptional regulator
VEFKQRAFISPQELVGNPEIENVRDFVKLIELSIVKAIAGLMNTNGGILLIGIKDDGKVFGIENDLVAIKTKNDPDGFNQRLSRQIEVYLGLVNIRFLKTRFVNVDFSSKS